jgi:serine/threonine-protein kinase
LIGKILGNRYQVVEKIGDGGTAFVFRGLDTLLNRNVTIKVLRPEYVSDQEFVRRFRREAQAAASLSHPNVVSIYDVGCEDGIHFIVMEYVKGQSLKNLIEEMGHLPIRLAVDYACQTAQALDHAHRHGIIHRDIKPHNILLNSDGRVKVTDFGIAQAVTSSTLTYHNGTLLGSVHYFSPEQARGGQTGEKSDIYSLGVVLYEMLTGRVPYGGDSPVSVAVKHLQEPFPDPRATNPDVPASIAHAVRKAVEKDPERRFRSAREMSDELAGWLTGRLPRFAGREPEKDAASATPPDRRKSGINRRYLLPLLLLLLAAVFVILVVQLRAFFIVPEVQVPHVEGLSATQAVEVLTEAGLGSQIVDQIPDDNVPVGHVLRQTPAPGRMVKKNRQVDLILSTGPVLVEVAEVIGKTELEATLILQGQGFTVTPIEEFSDQPPGTVIRQDPGRGFKLPRGREVKLTISKGGRPFKLRDLTGLTLEDARSWLELFGLVERFVEERESEQPAGIVIGQHPAAGELVKSGDPVDLEVSKGMGNTSPVQRSIRIDTSSIPLGEKIVLTISDSLGRRVENYVNTGETIVTQGFGYGEVEVRWQDKVEKKNFPE